MHDYALAFLLLAACGPVQPATSGPASTVVLASPAQPSSSDCAPPPYVPHAPWSGRAAALPTPPELPNSPQKLGDSYTVYGAVHLLNLGVTLGNKDLEKELSIVGYIVDTNLARAPACALHRVGVRDPADCVTEIPTFTLGDVKGSSAMPRIRAMGWASNFAHVFDANAYYKKLTQRPARLYQDSLWSTDVPYPLPSVGAKVKVTGTYGVAFTKSSAGVATDPQLGILTVREVVYLEAAPGPAKLGN